MTVSQKKNRLAQMVLQTNNKQILNAIELLFEQNDVSSYISDKDKIEIDKRLSEVEEGKAKYYTVTEMKKIVRSAAKKK